MGRRGLTCLRSSRQFDENFAQGLQKAGDAMDWCREHADGLKTGVKLLAVAFGLVKLAQFNQSVAGGASALLGMGKTVLTMTGVLGGQTAATGAATAAQTGTERRDERKPDRRGNPSDRGRDRGRCAAV